MSNYSGFKRKDWASGRAAGSPLAARGYKAGGQTTSIQHREFISNIVSGPSASGAFNRCFPSGAPINPGNASLFPWLNRCAQSFIQYKINYMKFHYVSTSGEFTGGASGNAALGSVNMCVQYNSNMTAYTNKASMLNEEGAVSVVPSRDGVLHLKVQPQSVMKKQYVRGPGQTGAYDPLMYDLGIFYVATDGTPTPNIVLGEIWVEYDITFYKSSQVNNLPSGVIYSATGRIPQGSDPNLLPGVQGTTTGSSGAYLASAAGAAGGTPARAAGAMPRQFTPIAMIPTNPLPGVSGSSASSAGSTSNGGVSVDGTTIVIPQNTLDAYGAVQITLSWLPAADETGKAVPAVVVGTNSGTSAYPFVAASWDDSIWDITNGVCLNCSKTNMSPTTGLTLSANSTTMVVQVIDPSQDIVIKWAARTLTGNEAKVILPYIQTPGAPTQSMQWAVDIEAIRGAVAITLGVFNVWKRLMQPPGNINAIT